MIFPFIVQVSSEDGLSEYGEEPAGVSIWQVGQLREEPVGVSIWQVGQLREEDRDSPRLRQSWAHDNTAATMRTCFHATQLLVIFIIFLGATSFRHSET